MTERLYYTDSRLTAFEARVLAVRQQDGCPVLVLDRTAFYPASGGQPFDTGWIEVHNHKLRVNGVSEQPVSGKDLAVLHRIEEPIVGANTSQLAVGDAVRGQVDAERRRDHMQQHTGQHMLSAVCQQMLGLATLSFHMGDDVSTIDLDTPSLTPEQATAVELRVNRYVRDDLPVSVRFVTPEEALALGVRKQPPGLERVRLIDIAGLDLTACGGTHVSRTGEVGAILLRRTERVRQGTRVEFVCGERAVRTAARDRDMLRQAADLFSSHIWEVPEQTRKLLDDARALRKSEERLQAELAGQTAAQLLGEAEQVAGWRLVCRCFPDRDVAWIKLLAQRITAQPDAIVLLASTAGACPAIVFGQSPGGPLDMGALMKQTTARLGGRGGGSRDMAQGGLGAQADAEAALKGIAAELKARLTGEAEAQAPGTRKLPDQS